MGNVIEFPNQTRANTVLHLESRRLEETKREPEEDHKEGIVQVYHRLMMESLNLDNEKGMKLYEYHRKKWLKAKEKSPSRLIERIKLVLHIY